MENLPTWSLEGKIDMYSYSKTAFDSHQTDYEKKSCFNNIYNSLKGDYQVFRNANGECWDSNRIFEFLFLEMKEFDRKVNLLNINNDQLNKMENILEKMRSLKPLKYNCYPTMAVSKFLHFFNPGLFPIYDNAIVEDIAFSVFKNDYTIFCNYINPNYVDKGCEFIIMYVKWVKSIFEGIETNEIMNEYVDFFTQNIGVDYGRKEVLMELNSYYAAAFENIFIGAAYIEKN
ncbi:hypothetical protein ES708_32773 [subsurface metagenome]